MITLHHLENSQSIRILWLLEELGAEYGYRMYDRDPETMLAPDAYKALSPFGTAPAITDGDVAISESNAIIDYVLDRTPDHDLRPAPDDTDRADYLFWFHAAQGTLQPLLTMRFVHGIAVERSPRLVRGIIRKVMGLLESAFIGPRLTAAFTALDTQLADNAFVAGERFTAADIALGYTLFMADQRGGLLEPYGNIRDYVGRMNARPAWQRALEKDGKFLGVPA